MWVMSFRSEIERSLRSHFTESPMSTRSKKSNPIVPNSTESVDETFSSFGEIRPTSVDQISSAPSWTDPCVKRTVWHTVWRINVAWQSRCNECVTRINSSLITSVSRASSKWSCGIKKPFPITMPRATFGAQKTGKFRNRRKMQSLIFRCSNNW